ncbi:MAG: alpha-L-fucosidase [Edaphobacter sp.]
MSSLDRRKFLWMAAGAPSLFSHASAKTIGQDEVPSYLRDYADAYRRNPRAAAMDWFRHANFGMFMHYGLYSQLGRAEWVMLRETIPFAQYVKLKDTFNPVRFDADAIVQCALDAKMKYVTLTAKHHEGFCLFRTRETTYNSTNSPTKKDLVGELAEACHKKGVGLFLYYSYGADWHHPYFCDPSAGWEDYRPAYKEKPAQYRWTKDADTRIYVNYAQNQVRELLTQYGPIAGIWFDPLMGYLARPDLFHLKETYAMIRRLQPQCLISFKQGGTGTEDFAAPERGVAGIGKYHTIAPDRRKNSIEVAAKAWASNRTKKIEICDTLQQFAWCYKKSDDGKHRGPAQMIPLAKDAWAQGANYLLNTGLLPDGSIAPEDVLTYRAVGKALPS